MVKRYGWRKNDMRLALLKNEIVKPVYCMCNECKNLDFDTGICEIYKMIPPKDILSGNSFKGRRNVDICKYFEENKLKKLW